MINEALISVIVPVYNVAPYLKRCLDSLVNQSYKLLEIILVNDGSTDNSEEICHGYTEKYQNFKLVSQNNGGLSSARNTGLRYATGEYIAFLDSDDWVERDTYEYALKLIQSSSADISDFDCMFSYQYPDEVIRKEEKIEEYEGQDVLWSYLYRGLTIQNNAPYSACRKLYKRQAIEGILFPEGKISEDLWFNYLVMKRAGKIIYSNQVKYHYFSNRESISSGKLSKKSFALIEFSQKIYDTEKNNKYHGINKLAEAKLARSYFSLLARFAKEGCTDDIEEPNIIAAEYTRKLRKYFMPLMRSPIAVSRKILILIFCIDYRVISVPYEILKSRFLKE